MSHIQRIGNQLAHPGVFFFTLLWLMVLVFIGTVAQKTLGLYQAQYRYFSSFIVWMGGIPLPAGYTTMGFLSLCLLAKLVFKSTWHWKRAGTIIAHMGGFVLLAGGLLTALFSNEGAMILYEGERAGFITDYHDRQLEILPDGDPGAAALAIFPAEQLTPGTVLEPGGDIPFTIRVLDYCRNCGLNEKENGALSLAAKPLEPEDEKNLSAVTLQVMNAEGKAHGRHLAYEYQSLPPVVEMDGARYRLVMRRKRYTLPFTVELLDFDAQYHPGTDTPRSFTSTVKVIDGDTEWRTVIAMNEPLRYKGYTLFQSSFVNERDREASVFAVVYNVGRMFPYISSIIICIGLLVHLTLQVPRLIKERRR